MTKINNHIQIVRSTSKALSSMSQESVNAIYKTLSKYYEKVGITTVNNIVDLNNLVELKPDLVFLGVEFIPTNPELGTSDPDKIWVSDYLDEFNIAFTGSNQAAHNLQRNKHLAKQRVIDFGLSTSPYHYSIKGNAIDIQNTKLKYPMFVKPSDRGGGLGIDTKSIVNNFDELQQKVNYISDVLNSDSLVENYLTGREFSVAILKNIGSDDYMVMPLELIAPEDELGHRILSGTVKSADAEKAIEVSNLILKERICELALNVFHAIGARDYGRIDIRLDENGIPYFLESNLIPSLIQGYGSFPKACVINIDLNYEQMIVHIANLGIARQTKYSIAPINEEIFIISNEIAEVI
jgi:D-alanine-D-alanine ligase